MRREGLEPTHHHGGYALRNQGMDAVNQALQQITKSPFIAEIESSDQPYKFVQFVFVIYNGKSDLVEHVSHFNQSMALYA